jgi:hypothetical protein
LESLAQAQRKGSPGSYSYCNLGARITSPVEVIDTPLASPFSKSSKVENFLILGDEAYKRVRGKIIHGKMINNFLFMILFTFCWFL